MKRTPKDQQAEAHIEQMLDVSVPRADAQDTRAPIGIFDSGFGGLTVVREVARQLPDESIIYLGDSARCPYGPSDLRQVDSYVQQIGHWLVDQGCKLLLIACNTATAAGLEHARETFPVPVVGVIEPGARAAVEQSRNRRIGVIATKGTVASGAYAQAIRRIDPSITVFSSPAPRFVEIAELGIRMAVGPIETFTSQLSDVYIRPEFQEIASEYLEPIRRCHVDTLVMGCTHYPLLESLIGSVMGHEVTLISSATEAARDVASVLTDLGMQVPKGNNVPIRKYYTTGYDVEEFCRFGSRVFGDDLTDVHHVELP